MSVASRIKAQVGIGFHMSSRLGGPRGLPEKVLAPGGYIKWLQEDVQPWYERGYKLGLVHNPFGKQGQGKVMDLDARHHLLASQYAHVITDFLDMRDLAKKLMPDFLWVDYYGTYEDDLAKMMANGAYTNHMCRMFSSIEESLQDPTVMYAQDAASYWPDGHIMEAFVESVKTCKAEQGLPIFCESLPEYDLAGKSWQLRHHAICLERRFEWASTQIGRSFRLESDQYFTVRWLTNHVADAATPDRIFAFLRDVRSRKNSIPVISNNVLGAKFGTVHHDDLLQTVAQIEQDSPAVDNFWHSPVHGVTI